jgi:hypothetical protein
LRDGFAAHFLFTFDQKFDIQRQCAVHCAQGFDGFDVHIHLTLIVGGAAAVEIAVAEGRLERRARPQLERIGGLHVIVSIAQDGGLAECMKPVGIYQRMFGGGDDFDVLHPNDAQALGHKFGGAADIALMFRQRAHAGDTQEIFQLIEETIAILFDKSIGSGRHKFLPKEKPS